MSAEITSPAAYAKKLPSPQLIYVVDFFCGYGGMSYGFSITRQSHLAFRVLAGIDIDASALATFERNVKAPGIKADIAAIGDDPAMLGRLLPELDFHRLRPLVFIGCAPCQGFSAMRKGDERDDARNNLLMAFARITAHFRPDVLVMENVPELLKGRFSRYHDLASRKLKRAGYSLSEGVLDLSLFGVPQRRRRAIVLGALQGRIEPPSPIFAPRDALTVRHAISHLHPLVGGQSDAFDPAHRAPNHTARLVKLFKAIPPDGGDRRALPAALQLKAHARLDKSDTPGFTDVYGRLRWDLPSVTITAKSRSPSSGRFLHPEQHRNITVREAAILQGFPQTFIFEGSPTQHYRHIGEAVPPLFARFLAWQILDHFSPRRGSIPSLLTAPVRPTRQVGRLAKGLLLVDGFCGAGGISLGFEAGGVDVGFAFDLDPDAVATFNHNVSERAEVFDVRSPALVRRIDDAVGEAAYIIAGGPPCQGFSHQRRGEPDDPRNRLVLRFAHLIGKLKRPPAAIVLENVTDLDLPRGKRVLQEFLKRLSALGYRAFRHDLNSTDFGVPQLRNRIVIVAVPESVAPWYKGPEPLLPTRWCTVGEALAGLPEPGEHSSSAAALPNHVASAEGVLNKRRIAYVDMGYGRKSIPVDLQLACHAKSYRGHRDVYGRLDWFSQARTLTGGFDSFTRGEYAHPFQHRSLTSREAARLQGFPDWFAFMGNRASVRRQIGNAVPPTVAYAIACALSAALHDAGEARWAS